MPGKQRDRAVPRTPGQRLLSRHRVRALSPLPWGGSGTHWRGSRDRPCWGAHATAQRDQGGTGTHGEGARLGQQIPPCWEAAGPRGDSSGVLGSQPFPEQTQHSMVMPVPGLPGKPNPCLHRQQRLQSTHSSGSAWSCPSWQVLPPLQPREDSKPGSQPKPGPPCLDDSQLHSVCFHPPVPAAPGCMGAAVGPN